MSGMSLAFALAVSLGVYLGKKKAKEVRRA